MNIRLILILFFIFFVGALVASYHNELPVDGTLEIGFPLRFIHYINSQRHTGFHFGVDALLADIAVVLAAAWGVERAYFYIRKRINSA